NDPAGTSQVFDDQTIQDVMDESRVDVRNQVLKATPTFSGSTIKYLDYFSGPGTTGWEDGYVLKQYLINVVTPSLLEPIAGHWQFAASTLPPVYISGSLHDRYRAAADLLERMAAQWVLRYSMTVDGQNLQRGNVTVALQNLAKTYRMKQRPGSINLTRSDVHAPSTAVTIGLQATQLDYMGSGEGR
ncbi:MAG: hypothetical protein ACRDHW_00895, partial [Ktedonobacteraceae bacterium]